MLIRPNVISDPNLGPIDLVVVGLGYVGMQLAREACSVGLRVAGLDRDEALLANVGSGVSHVDNVCDSDLRAMLSAGFAVAGDERIIERARTVAICVGTPLGAQGWPDLTAVEAAARGIARHLRRDTLVILESTSYPGTTEEVVQPILETSGLRAGQDFRLAFSPERIDISDADLGLIGTPKVVGGLTAQCTSAAAAFYGKFVRRVVPARGPREAEMAKLLENVYRQVNIALVNELAMHCRDLGIDVWDVISCASTKPAGFQAFRPGPGVGGHCIPIDPCYLAYKVRAGGGQFRLVELAQQLNQEMPGYVVRRAEDMLRRAQRPLPGATVLLLGVTYKRDVTDQRGAPARPIAMQLRERGAVVSFHDPYADSLVLDGESLPRVSDLRAALAEADLAILVVDHAMYGGDLLSGHARLLLDTRGVTHGTPAAQVELL